MRSDRSSRLLRLPGRSTRCTTAPSACFPPWTAPSSAGCSTKFSTTTRPTRTSAASCAGSKQAIGARAGLVCGVTTDGSPLYPDPLALIFPGVPHQVCEFHILKELTKVVLRVVARIANAWRSSPEAAPRAAVGIPEARRKVLRAKRIERRVAELFEHRHLFVRHHLSAANGRPACSGCAEGSRSCGRYGRSWTRYTACSTAAAARTRRLAKLAGCGNGYGVTAAWDGAWTS